MYSRTIVTVVVGLYSSRIVLRELGVENYGIYNVVGGIVTLFAFLKNALSQSTQRFMSYEMGKGPSGNLREVFSMNLNVHILLALFIIIVGEVVGIFLFRYSLVIPADKIQTAHWLYQFSLLSSAFSVTQVPFNAVIFANEKFGLFSYISFLEVFLKLGIAVSLVYLKGDLLFYYGLLILFQVVIVTTVNKIICYFRFPETHYFWVWNKKRFKNIFSYSSWSLVGNLADALSDQGVNILLNMFFGPAVNASRGIAVSVKQYVTSFVGNFQGVSNPQIVKLFSSGQIEEMKGLVFMTSKMSFFLFLFFMFPLCLEMNIVINLWLGQVPDYVVPFAIISLTQILLMSVSGTLQTIIQATGKIKFYHLSSGVLKLTAFPICYIALKLGGSPIIPFIIVCFLYSLIVYVNLYVLHKLIDFPAMQYLKNVVLLDFKVLFISIILPLAVRLYFEESVQRLLFTVVSSVISVAFSVYIFGFTGQERSKVKFFFKKKFNK